MNGGNRSQTPLRPIKIKGKKYFVLLVHNDVAHDIRTNSKWEQAQREAQLRGGENPIFTGALGIMHGVVIHEHENINITTKWGVGNNVAGATNVFMGAQALCWAWGMRPKLVAENFDYQREHGYAWDMIYGVKKPKFNGKDYGSIAVYTARTKISDVS